nr:DUF2231 domain-containing protein [Marortus luteolus]
MPTILTGLLELSRAPEGAPMQDAYWHMAAMLLALTLFTTRLLLRVDHLQIVAPNTASLWIDATGFLSLTVGGWLGGRLVYEHGVGTR